MINLNNTKKFNYDNIPCIIYSEVNLTAFNHTPCANCHEDLELQLFTAGEGNVFIIGENYHVKEIDIVVKLKYGSSH